VRMRFFCQSSSSQFILLCLLVGAQSVIPANGTVQYTLNDSIHYLLHAYAANCPPTQILNWNCYWCNFTNEHFNTTHVFYNSITNTFGYAGYNSREIMIVFRGTQMLSLENIITDLESLDLVAYPRGKGLEVADGFYDAYKGVEGDVLRAYKYLRMSFPHFPLVLNGHSLGGSLSSMCAIDIVERYGENITQWTYGSPRIGNKAFTEYYYQKMQTVWRTVNKRDIVPHYPFIWEGFSHTAREVWFPVDYTHFRICDQSGEDPSCSDSLVYYSIWDHLLYLGYNHRDGVPYGC